MRSNWLRTVLTLFGILIGVAAIILVFSAGEGIKSMIIAQVESFGTNIIETEIKVPTNKTNVKSTVQASASMVMGAQITTLSLDDMKSIDKLPNVLMSYPGIMSQEQASYKNEFRKAIIFGTNENFIKIDKSEVAKGRFFTKNEDKSLSSVVILGLKIKKDLFGDLNPLGEYVKIKNRKYKVIGVMEERGAVMGMDFDNFIYMPIQTLQKKVMGVRHILYMVHKLKDVNDAENTAQDIRMILRANHNIRSVPNSFLGESPKDDFRVSTMKDMMAILDKVTRVITWLLFFIVLVALLVGGVGIMNIMYVIISERTMEIGLRKAVGASYFDIIYQFLTESVIISLFGSILGILIGVFLSYLIYLGANAHYDWAFVVPIKSIFISLGFSFFFGVIFGILPARKAAKLSPVEALSVE